MSETFSGRGRPRNPIPRDELHVSIDQDVAVYWRLQFFDSFLGATQKGKLSELINRLLRDEMNKTIAASTPSTSTSDKETPT